MAGSARGDEPASAALAKEAVELARGERHRERMHVVWSVIEDETPPDGAEVVLVQGYQSYFLTRFVVSDTTVKAASIGARRSWFYDRNGEDFRAWEFDVDRERFVAAWNAARRILAASDERNEPEPPDHPRRGSTMRGSHESADWIRIRRSEGMAPLHVAGRASSSYDWDDVRRWDGIRDESVFRVFSALVPDANAMRGASAAPWGAFAADTLRKAASALDTEVVQRDDAFLDTCLRIAGEFGDGTTERQIDVFRAALAERGGDVSRTSHLRDECARTATRLQLRLRWDPADAVRVLRELPGGTWADGDQAKWVRLQFRTRDPARWAAFAIEEVARPDARASDVEAAAADVAALPADVAAPVLRPLLAHANEYVRLAAAQALHRLLPDDAAPCAVVVALALDRTIACDRRADLTDRWSRARALAAALEWGGLTPQRLREHVLAPEEDDPEFVELARCSLDGKPERLTAADLRGVWRRVLDLKSGARVLAAVTKLVWLNDVESSPRMLEALDRLEVALVTRGARDVGVEMYEVSRCRRDVEGLGGAAGPPK